ncbi:amino acid adenylation domain-containing protein [Pelagicoccus albus]|uniref:Amino acid adenylation domain-containing protein n=1 Tax=Pelagicoccus albus TaxID=415222 RepID=A0A7X1BBM9_9BACT|nr:amino acid adenylation domain-containing protein [Pelagicoccus albus]MBC2607980.1 amino acid adenylation domain-containing protein [Pelagicoccus albus]
MLQTCLHQSIERNALERPDSIAFRCRGDLLTYAQLYTAACQLANTLLEQGLSPLDRVGIHMNKSLELPVAIYGILLAGGVYVPIDASAPLNRIEFIIQDCGIHFLVTNKEKRRTIASLEQNQKLPLRTVIGIQRDDTIHRTYVDWCSIYDSVSAPPENKAKEDDLAYIMYTSGSTGLPKGLMHTHRSGLAYARHSADLYQVVPEDILGNHAPIHFDISTFELLTGPFVGATTVLIPEEELMFPASLARLIERERLTFWYSVPLALTQLVLRGEWEGLDLSSLRWVLFGGEPFPPKYLSMLMDRLPGARFCNVYGPAEVNQCSYYHVPDKESLSDEPVPIGHIWDAAHHLLLDDENHLIEKEGTGELLISASTMMQGYWGRSDLNEKAFFHEEPVSGFKRRYYRTGDLMQRDQNGILHFLGRKDRQIKLRGYRIELDEIEAAFTQQLQVEEAAAIVVEDPQGEKTIVAYYKPSIGSSIDSKELLSTARKNLPSYAVPSRILSLDTFPRTGSGKIDRIKLAELDNERTVS